MLYAWSEATVPKIVMAVGKVVGGARPAMCSWELHPDFIFAWPTAQMVVVGAEGAVDICRKHELKAAEENGEDLLVPIEDDAVFDEIAEIFEERLSDLYEVEELESPADEEPLN